MSTTLVVHLELQIYLREFSKKFGTALMGYSGALGKLNHKKPEVENLVALSL
jgi:hypothetical protein